MHGLLCQEHYFPPHSPLLLTQHLLQVPAHMGPLFQEASPDQPGQLKASPGLLALPVLRPARF